MSKMIKCKTCNNEIASSAKTCPMCGAKNKKPLYKRTWFMVIEFFIIVGIIIGVNGGDSTTKDSETASTRQESTEKPKSQKKVPSEYKSALKKAKVYSDTMNMSKAGLYDQLTSEYGEKFTAEAAQYAVDNLDADWKKNALKTAKTYQESMAMSPSAIYDQLISQYGEKFTKEEAQYAIDNLK